MQAEEEVMAIKGKRSKRPRPASPLALAVACSSSTIPEQGGGASSEAFGSCNRVSVNLSSFNSVELGGDGEEEDMANCLILLAKGQSPRPSRTVTAAAAVGVYQCKTCNKSFPSFQALGGHRASHKKPIKAIVSEEKRPSGDKHENSSPIHGDGTILSLQIPGRISESPHSKTIRVHECSICGAEFASGQALGGHMRRHRPIPAVAAGSHGEQSDQEAKRPRKLLPLDLNLPASDDHDQRDQSSFRFAEQVIVFSASPLVDCHF